MTQDNRIDEILEITSLVPTAELKPEPPVRIKPTAFPLNLFFLLFITS